MLCFLIYEIINEDTEQTDEGKIIKMLKMERERENERLPFSGRQHEDPSPEEEEKTNQDYQHYNPYEQHQKNHDLTHSPPKTVHLTESPNLQSNLPNQNEFVLDLKLYP